MNTVVNEKENEVRNLTVHDRCDQCDSQAYVSVTGISGELFFCAHHFTKIKKNKEANEKLKAFAYVINDERDKLSSKRAGL
jgi:hypothetical protein